jgi:hypothetical protein
MNNFHTLMAVLGGLNEGPIYRLKHTIAEIPQKLKDVRHFHGRLLPL